MFNLKRGGHGRTADGAFWQLFFCVPDDVPEDMVNGFVSRLVEELIEKKRLDEQANSMRCKRFSSV